MMILRQRSKTNEVSNKKRGKHFQEEEEKQKRKKIGTKSRQPKTEGKEKDRTWKQRQKPKIIIKTRKRPTLVKPRLKTKQNV